MSHTLISARTAGVIYLAIIGLGLFGEVFVRGSLVVGGDAAATASNILGAQQLWRVGVATDLLMHVLDVPLIVFFYLLLKPIDRHLALLATVFNVVQTCILAANKLTLVAALSLVASKIADAPSLALMAIDLHAHGFGIGLVFFGLTCVLRGILILRSTYVPRPLGVLLVLAGAGYLVNTFALLVHPPLAAALFPAILLPALVAELALSIWLLATRQSALQQKMDQVTAGQPHTSNR
jgi:hypothetical protein